MIGLKGQNKLAQDKIKKVVFWWRQSEMGEVALAREETKEGSW